MPSRPSEPSIPRLIVARESPRRSRGHADLGGDHELLAVAPRRDPAADDPLGLAGPAGTTPPVGVGRVDEVAARLDVGVEHGEGALLVDRPAEHVPAQAQREDVQIGVAQARDAIRVPARAPVRTSPA